jgi:hypothetical protein
MGSARVRPRNRDAVRGRMRARMPTPSRHPRRLLAALFLGLLAVTGACSKATEDPLAPMARMARSGMTEIEARVTKAHQFLADQVAADKSIQALFADPPPPEDKRAPDITWGSTPYVVVGAFRTDGTLIALPHAADALEDLMKQSLKGPEVGDLVRIPNTFAFTVAVRQPVPGHEGAKLVALLDVDRVLVNDVLQPLAEAAHGFAFLADGEGNTVLTTLPAITGRALSAFQIPLPDPGKEATGTVTIESRRYDVATARSAGLHRWVVGIGVASAPAAQPEERPQPRSGPPGAVPAE